jgi:hypothetical protein
MAPEYLIHALREIKLSLSVLEDSQDVVKDEKVRKLFYQSRESLRELIKEIEEKITSNKEKAR